MAFNLKSAPVESIFEKLFLQYELLDSTNRYNLLLAKYALYPNFSEDRFREFLKFEKNKKTRALLALIVSNQNGVMITWED